MSVSGFPFHCQCFIEYPGFLASCSFAVWNSVDKLFRDVPGGDKFSEIEERIIKYSYREGQRVLFLVD